MKVGKGVLFGAWLLIRAATAEAPQIDRLKFSAFKSRNSFFNTSRIDPKPSTTPGSTSPTRSDSFLGSFIRGSDDITSSDTSVGLESYSVYLPPNTTVLPASVSSTSARQTAAPVPPASTSNDLASEELGHIRPTVPGSGIDLLSSSQNISLPPLQVISDSTHTWVSSPARSLSSFEGVTYANAPNATAARSTTRNHRTSETSSSTKPLNGSITNGTNKPKKSSARRRPRPKTTVTVDCPVNGDVCFFPGRTRKPKPGWSTVTVTRECTPFHDDKEPMTVFYIVHTSTVTFYGNRSSYTPPFQTIKTPHYCSTDFPMAGPPAMQAGPPDMTETEVKGKVSQGHRKTSRPQSLNLLVRPKVTFVTTDKNPAVVFPSDPVSQGSEAATDAFPGPLIHQTVPPEEIITAEADGQPTPYAGKQPKPEAKKNPKPEAYQQPTREAVHQPTPETARQPTPEAAHQPTPEAVHQPTPTFRIIVQDSRVAINTQNFTPGPDITTVVTVDGGRFTIDPTAIVGEGGSVAKRPAPPTAGSIATPTFGYVGGLSVSLSGSEAVIGGIAMTIPPWGATTETIRGQSVTVGTDRVAVEGETLRFNASGTTKEPDALIIGGEMLTAIGQRVVVVHSRTITYGTGVPAITEVIQGDTVTIGSNGIYIHGTTIGGSGARTRESRLEIVGGATVTKIAPSIALINGKTFTIGPGAAALTTVIGDQTFSLGPGGVIVSTVTMSYPFGSPVVTSIVPTGTWLTKFPAETGPIEDEDSSGSLSRPSLAFTGTALCIAIGVLFLG